MRITWIKPEELIEHELVQAVEENRDVASLRAYWEEAKMTKLDVAELRQLIPGL